MYIHFLVAVNRYLIQFLKDKTTIRKANTKI